MSPFRSPLFVPLGQYRAAERAAETACGVVTWMIFRSSDKFQAFMKEVLEGNRASRVEHAAMLKAGGYVFKQ